MGIGSTSTFTYDSTKSVSKLVKLTMVGILTIRIINLISGRHKPRMVRVSVAICFIVKSYSNNTISSVQDSPFLRFNLLMNDFGEGVSSGCRSWMILL